MKADIREEFESIASVAIEDAEQIECSLTVFAEGLEAMVETLQFRLEQVQDEIRVKEESEEVDDGDDD